MRVCLFWNETAGGGVSLDDLRAQIARAGHSVSRVVERSDDLRDHLHHDFDVVAAAGGDGTIARAGRALAGTDVPLAILPLGTANNIATSLGISAETDELISRWSRNDVACVDVGLIESSKKPRFFLESVGFGLATETMDAAKHAITKDDPQTHLEEARQLYGEVLERLVPRRYSLAFGDHELSGEYVLIEALNTPLIGPGLKLTEAASPADGLLSVVAVTAEHKQDLATYLDALRRGSAHDAGFKSWRVASLEVRGGSTMHVDDRVADMPDGHVRISVRPSALSILA